MPAMPRVNNKVKKIAENILGKPANQSNDKRRRTEKINKRLIYEDSNQVK